MKAKKIRVRLVVKKPSKTNSSYQQGALVPTVLRNNTYHAGKEFLLHRLSLEDALKKATAWGVDKAREYNVDFEFMSIEKIKEKLAEPKEQRRDLSNKVKPNEKQASILVEALSHQGKRKAVIRHAISSIGYVDLHELLTDTLNDFNDIAGDYKDKIEKEDKASRELAKAMLKIQKDTGLDMRSKIDDPKVLRIFKELLVESRNRQQYRPTENFGIYLLNGERWNEQTQPNPPTTFKKWLHENNKDDFEELRIGT